MCFVLRVCLRCVFGWKIERQTKEKYTKNSTRNSPSYINLIIFTIIFVWIPFSILFFCSSLLHLEKGKRVLVLGYNKFSSEILFLLRSFLHLLIIFNLIERKWDFEWLYHLENGHNLYPLQTKRDRLREVHVMYTRRFQGIFNWFTKILFYSFSTTYF